MTFLWPWFFLLIIPYVLVVFIYKRKRAFPFSSVKTFSKVPSSLRARLCVLPEILGHLAFLALLLALARPQTSSQISQRSIEGIDIMIALDVSESMLIEDMKPVNRLEASKAMIEDFIRKKVSARIGLVVFSGESYSPVPMTLDYPLIIEKLKQVDNSLKLRQGTAIGLSLLNSVDRLKASTAKNRVIIFLTDGENNSGNVAPEVALEVAKSFGVKIYTIAMGKDGDAQIPTYIKTPSGRVIKRYRPYRSRVNKALLKKMASETKGLFFEAQDGKVLKNVFDKIDQLEKTKIKTKKKIQADEKFYKFLIVAFWLYLASMMLRATLFRRVS